MMRFMSKLLQAALLTQAKLEALAAKYKMDKDVVAKIADMDPTPTGQFSDWLLREASRGGDLAGITSLLGLYIKVKRNPEWAGERDILKYSLASFREAMEKVDRESYSKKQKVRDIEENVKKYLQEGVRYLGKVDGCYAYQITTPTASAAMSKGTHWCTQSEGTSNSYLSKGSIYVFTKSGYVNDYGNDKYIQIFVSPRIVEAEMSSGKDLSSTTVFGKIYTEECMGLLEFLGNFNEIVKKGLEDETIYLSDGSELVCCSCDTPLDEDDGVTSQAGDIYCQDCYYDRFTICDQCGAEILTEDGLYAGDATLCQTCGKYCPSCEKAYAIVGRKAVSFYEVNDYTDDICEKCFNENYFVCEMCDNTFNLDQVREDMDGGVICSECHEELWMRDAENKLREFLAPNSDKLRDLVLKKAEGIFQHIKPYLEPYFEKAKRNGYLFEWEDFGLDDAVSLMSNVSLLSSLKVMVADPEGWGIRSISKRLEEKTDDWIDSDELEDTLEALGFLSKGELVSIG